MTCKRDNCIGRIFVRVSSYDPNYDVLRAATEGCAVIRCEYLAYSDTFEVYIHHPDLEPTQEGALIPTYTVIMEGFPSLRRVRFEKAPSEIHDIIRARQGEG